MVLTDVPSLSPAVDMLVGLGQQLSVLLCVAEVQVASFSSPHFVKSRGDAYTILGQNHGERRGASRPAAAQPEFCRKRILFLADLEIRLFTNCEV